MFTELMPLLRNRRLLLAISLLRAIRSEPPSFRRRRLTRKTTPSPPHWKSPARRGTRCRSFITLEVSPHTLEKPFTQRKFTAIVPLMCS
jgi:hypothetical protein